ncbi:MAG: ATP-binding protein, partial [Verrucomicrobiota bacterium]
PEDRAAFDRLVAESLEPSGDGRHQMEYRIQRPDGQIRWIRDWGQTLFEGEGKDRQAVRVIGLFQDITQQKEAEAALLEADRRKDEFLATLAHELRNPLAPLRNGLEVMKMVPPDSADFRDTQYMLERQLDQMVRLVDDLIDIARINRGQFRLQREPVCIDEVIDTAVSTVQPLFQERGHRFEAFNACPGLMTQADAARLTQAIANLLGNAAKYTRNGGEIKLHCHQKNDCVQIAVSDNGDGIDPLLKDRIFDMFTQATSPEFGHSGLGIGLTLVKTLIEMHGGSIEVESPGTGKGSTFTIFLPLDKAINQSARPADKPPATEDGADDRKCRILIADDNVPATKVLAIALNKVGHEIKIAHNGEQALEIGAQFQPQVVLMDIGMPEMNGYEAAKKIRQTDWGSDVFLVALTGWAQEKDRERTRQAGFDEHIVKPPKIADLRKLINEGCALKLDSQKATSATKSG